MSSFSKFRILILIFCLAFAARAAFYFQVKKHEPQKWSPQALHVNGWLDIAENLVAGKGYSNQKLLTYFPVPQPEPTAARGPAPIFLVAALLWIFKQHYYFPLFFYAWALSAASAVALYVLAKKLGGEKFAQAAALLYCFYFPEMALSTSYAAGSESLFTFLLLLYSLAALDSLESAGMGSAFAAGILLGLAFLTRPVILFFPLLYAIAAVMRLRLKALPKIVALCAAFLICSAPWALRNQKVFHKPLWTTTLGGYNLLRHNGMIEKKEYKIYSSDKFQPIAQEVVAKSGHDFKDLNEVEIDALFKKEGMRIIRAYPWRYLKLCAYRLFWLGYKIDGEKPLFLAQNLFIYFFMFSGLLFALFRYRTLHPFALHFFYFIAAHALINAQFRFILPLMPYAILMAVYGARRYGERLCFK